PRAGDAAHLVPRRRGERRPPAARAPRDPVRRRPRRAVGLGAGGRCGRLACGRGSRTLPKRVQVRIDTPRMVAYSRHIATLRTRYAKSGGTGYMSGANTETATRPNPYYPIGQLQCETDTG